MSSFIHDLTDYIGSSVMGLVFLSLIVWLCGRIPVVAWALWLLIFGGFFLMVTALPLFVIFAVYLPGGHYFSAIFTLALSIFMSIPWFYAVLPEIIKRLKNPDFRLSRTEGEN